MSTTRTSSGNVSQVPVNVVGSCALGRYTKISNERTYNMFKSDNGYPRDHELFEEWLVNFPGYQRVLNIDPNLPGRGGLNCVRGNFIVVVIAANVYQVSQAFGITFIGSLATTTGEVFIADNLNAQICIVDGLNAYVYNYLLNTPLTIQADGALGSDALVPSYVEYHNTFFLFGNGNTTAAGAFWYAYAFNPAGSPAADAQIIQNSQLALQTKADFAIAVKRIPGQSNNVIVFGQTVAEIWTNIGTLLNYSRNPTKNINYGCLSPSTIGEGGDILAWLATNQDESPTILAYVNNQVKKISTDGIDHLLSVLKAPQTSTALLYHSDGHLFYQLTFFDPRDNLSLLYDFNADLFYFVTDQDLNFHPARVMFYFNLKTYFLSLNSGALYQLSSYITTINENIAPANDPTLIYTMQRHRITSNIRQANGARFIANSLSLTLEQGTDLDYSQANKEQLIGQYLIAEVTNDNIVTEDGQQMIVENALDANYTYSDAYAYSYPPYDGIFYQPRIDLSFSKDGGLSWSNIVSHGLNPLGQYQNECHWENMGITNDLCFKFSFLGHYRFVVNNALLDIVL